MKLSPEFNLVYTIGFILEILGICFLAFALYVMPHAFFGFLYPLPAPIFSLDTWLEMRHNTRIYHILLIFLPFFLASMVCFFEARNFTARIEGQLLGQDDLSLAERVKVHYSQGFTSIARVLLSISVVFIVAWLFLYLIS